MGEHRKNSLSSTWADLVRDHPVLRGFRVRFPRTSRFVGNRFARDRKTGLHFTVGSIICFLCILGFYEFWEDLSDSQELAAFDRSVIIFANELRSPSMHLMVMVITSLADYQNVLFLSFPLLVYLAYRRHWIHLAGLVLSVGAGQLVMWLLKISIRRLRPEILDHLVLESSFAFPSGHTFLACSFYGLLGYYLFLECGRRWQRILVVFTTLLLILAVAFSRIYLGVHWPSDVCGGFFAGLAWLSMIITVLEIRRRFY